jgi:hypothetical protein
MNKILLLSTLFINLQASNIQELLFHGNCTTCHFVTKNKSAPSMKSIQNIYKRAFPIKKDFVEYMSNWAQHPNIEGSLMRDAISKYGLMPELAFDKDTLEEISDYIYELK